MAYVAEQPLGSRFITLGNEQFMRPLSVGDDWQQLLVAIRYSLMGPASNVSHSMFIGACYNSKGWFDPDCHIVGLFRGPIGTSAFPAYDGFGYVAASSSYTGSTTGMRVMARVAGTDYMGPSGFSATLLTPFYPRPYIFGATLNRTTSGSITCAWYDDTSTVDATVITENVFKLFLDGTVGTLGTLSPMPAATYTAPADKPLNTFYLANWIEVPRLAVYQYGAARLQ